MFKFVLIPAQEDIPLQELTADSSGGLTDDALVKHAKHYFRELTGAQFRADQIATASPEERRALALQVRRQLQDASTGGAGTAAVDNHATMDDDSLLDTIYRHQSNSSCDITAVTVPVPGNQYQAVSLYAADQAKELGLSWNKRATAILTACGHGGVVYGDTFVGRAHDDEGADIWKRIDFPLSDADPTAHWCRTARSPSGGGGGGSGGKATAASLSGLLQSRNNNLQTIDTNSSNSAAVSMYGENGAPPVQESWGCWTQTPDEIELVFPVEAGIKAKDCEVKFRSHQVTVTVRGIVILNDKISLFDPIVPDDCTFTLQDVDDHRELVVTLAKAEASRTWPWVIHLAE